MLSFEKFLIIGLGNPSYDKTVHNAGSMILESHMKSLELISKSNYFINKHLPNIYYFNSGNKKNKYYMNELGIPIREIVKYNKIKYIFVIFDDIRVDFGKWKIINERIHRGHNGLKSIFNENPNVKIYLISVGVGPKPDNKDLSTYVLSKIPENNILEIMELVNHIFIYIYGEIKKLT